MITYYCIFHSILHVCMFACPYIKLLKLVCVLTCKDLRLARCACWQRGYTIGTVGKVTAVGLLVQCSYSVLKIINILFYSFFTKEADEP